MNQTATPAALQNLQSLLQDRRIEEALTEIKAAAENVEKLDKNVAARVADIAINICGLDSAVKIMEYLSSADPTNPVLTYQYAVTLSFARKNNEALTQALKVLKAYPDNFEITNFIASIYAGKGMFEEAIEYYQKSLQQDSKNAAAIFGLSKAQRLNGNTELLSKFQAALNDTSSPEDKIKILLAIAKHHNDNGAFEDAWEHAKQANDLMYEHSPFPGAEVIDVKIEKIQSNYKTFATSTSVEEPVLVVGMPRSGTTLIEQILGNNTEFFQGGESPSLNFAIQYGSGENNIDEAGNLAKEQLDKAAEGYSYYYKQLGNHDKRVINKLPTNFMNVGFFKQMFPKGKVIYLERDYRDVIVSTFFEHFATPNTFTNRVEDIIEIYRRCSALMKFWQSLFNDDILTIQYEQLVAHPESELDKIAKFLGVDSVNLLGLDKLKNSVETPSLWQVRQGIYTDSIARYKRYNATKELATEF